MISDKLIPEDHVTGLGVSNICNSASFEGYAELMARIDKNVRAKSKPAKMEELSDSEDDSATDSLGWEVESDKSADSQELMAFRTDIPGEDPDFKDPHLPFKKMEILDISESKSSDLDADFADKLSSSQQLVEFQALYIHNQFAYDTADAG